MATRISWLPSPSGSTKRETIGSQSSPLAVANGVGSRPKKRYEAGRGKRHQDADDPRTGPHPQQPHGPIVEVLIAQHGNPGGHHAGDLPDHLALLAEPAQEIEEQ